MLDRLQGVADNLVASVRAGRRGVIHLSGPGASGKTTVLRHVVAELAADTEVLHLVKGSVRDSVHVFSELRRAWDALCGARDGHVLLPHALLPCDGFFDERTCSLDAALTLSHSSRACGGFSWKGSLALCDAPATSVAEFTFYKVGHRMGSEVAPEEAGSATHMYLKPMKHTAPAPNSVFPVAELKECHSLRCDVAERWGHLYRRGGVAAKGPRPDHPPAKRRRTTAPEAEEAGAVLAKRHCVVVIEGWEQLGLTETRSAFFAQFVAAVARHALVLVSSRGAAARPLDGAEHASLPCILDSEKVRDVRRYVEALSAQQGLGMDAAGIGVLVEHAAGRPAFKTIPALRHAAVGAMRELAALETRVGKRGEAWMRLVAEKLAQRPPSKFQLKSSRQRCLLLPKKAGDNAGDDDDDDDDDDDSSGDDDDARIWMRGDGRGFFDSVVQLAAFLVRIRSKQEQQLEDAAASTRRGKAKARVLSGLQQQRDRVEAEHLSQFVQPERLLAQIRTLVETHRSLPGNRTELAPHWYDPHSDLMLMGADLQQALLRLHLRNPDTGRIDPSNVTAAMAQKIAKTLGVPTAEQGGHAALFRHHGFV